MNCIIKQILLLFIEGQLNNSQICCLMNQNMNHFTIILLKKGEWVLWNEWRRDLLFDSWIHCAFSIIVSILIFLFIEINSIHPIPSSTLLEMPQSPSFLMFIIFMKQSSNLVYNLFYCLIQQISFHSGFLSSFLSRLLSSSSISSTSSLSLNASSLYHCHPEKTQIIHRNLYV